MLSQYCHAPVLRLSQGCLGAFLRLSWCSGGCEQTSQDSAGLLHQKLRNPACCPAAVLLLSCCHQGVTRRCRNTASANEELTFDAAALPGAGGRHTGHCRTTARAEDAPEELPGVQRAPRVRRSSNGADDRGPHQHRWQPCSAALRYQLLRQPLAEAVGVGERQGCRQRIRLSK
jgi:hypothetical protein